MKSKLFNNLLLFSLFGIALGFFGMLYEGVVTIPKMLDTSMDRMLFWRDYYKALSPLAYYIPLTPMASLIVVALFFVTGKGKAALKILLGQAAVLQVAALAITFYIVKIANLKMCFGDIAQYGGEIHSKVIVVNILSVVRLLLAAIALFLTFKLTCRHRKYKASPRRKTVTNKNMKRIIVFGATGGTGKHVVEQALAAGYQVTVVVRNPGAFASGIKNLEIIKGDVLQPATFENTLREKDTVVSCLGSGDRKPTTVYSKGTGNIIAAMRKAGVRRIICISAGAVVVPPKSSVVMKFVVKNILQRIFKYVYADMLLMEKMLNESDLNWTVIRAPRLTNNKHTEKYRTAINEPLSNLSNISRADLADYIIKLFDDEKTFKTITEVSY